LRAGRVECREQMLATIVSIVVVVVLVTLLIRQRDRVRARRRLLLRAIEAEARAETILTAPGLHAPAVARAVASQFRRT